MQETRQNRISRLLQKELSLIFQSQTRMMHGVMVSVTKVRVSPDLSICTAYLSVFPSEKGEEILKNINANEKTIRFDLGRKVRRYGPLDAIVKGRDIDALTIVPQNPGGAWNPKKIMDMLDWVKKNYPCDSNRVYVLGMSLGGYGTMDVCATYPDRIAAGMALCGGCSYKDVSGLGNLPFWIIHGTADRAVPVKQSKVVVDKLVKDGKDTRLIYDWWKGANHGTPARVFYLKKTYQWLFSHSLSDKDRPVNRNISITMSDLGRAYGDVNRNAPQPELIDGPSVIKQEGNEY